MHAMGVHVVVIRENSVLLAKRTDFEVWGLPGGEIETGETPAEAATREVLEETGLKVRLTRLVGLYTKPQWITVNSTNAVFAAEVIEGDLTTSDETLEVKFFERNALPETLIWWSRTEIEDALNGIGGSIVRTQEAPWPESNPTRRELYQQRDESGLARAEFFDSVFRKGPERVDVVGRKVRASLLKGA